MLGAGGSGGEHAAIADEADFIGVGDGHVRIVAAGHESERGIHVGGDVHDEGGESGDRIVEEQTDGLDDAVLLGNDEAVREDADLGGGSIGLQQGDDAIGVGIDEAAEDEVRFDPGGAEDVEMIVTKGDRHGAGRGLNRLAQLEAVANALEYRYGLRIEVDDGHEAVPGGDTAGIAAHAALPSGGQGLQQMPGGVIDHELVLDLVRRGDHQGAGGGGGGKGGGGPDQR